MGPPSRRVESERPTLGHLLLSQYSRGYPPRDQKHSSDRWHHGHNNHMRDDAHPLLSAFAVFVGLWGRENNAKSQHNNIDGEKSVDGGRTKCILPRSGWGSRVEPTERYIVSSVQRYRLTTHFSEKDPIWSWITPSGCRMPIVTDASRYTRYYLIHPKHISLIPLLPCSPFWPKETCLGLAMTLNSDYVSFGRGDNILASNWGVPYHTTMLVHVPQNKH